MFLNKNILTKDIKDNKTRNKFLKKKNIELFLCSKLSKIFS
jgi:hypothetical protein